MSLAGDLDPTTMDSLPPDPLLKPGAFIDPHPISDENFVPEPEPQPQPQPQPQPVSFQTGPTEHKTPAGKKAGSDPPPLDASEFDWLPAGWTVVERVRASGASAGSRDKYYMDPTTKRRFRSKKEVLTHLGIAVTPYKRKKKDVSVSDADTTPQANTETAQKKKRKKKSENTAEDLVKRFNFDDVPAKVKWELTQIYEPKWQPLVNGVDKVSESSKQKWAAAFTYLTVPNEESVLL